jgi:hypothetical protein
MMNSGAFMVKLFCRILDNLPLVVPIARQDKYTVVYQGGYHVGVKGQYHVGVKGQYAGVSLCGQLIISVDSVNLPYQKKYIHVAEQG